MSRRVQPFTFYLHPWEVDPGQPRLKVKWFSRFRHYNNLHKCEGRLRKLLGEFSFSTMRDVLEQQGLLEEAATASVRQHLAAAASA